MNAIDVLKERLKSVRDKLKDNTYIVTILHDYEADIADMNCQQQLYEHGVNANNVSISDYAPYSPVTVEYKMAMGQPYDRVTLRDTGDFHQGFKVEINPKAFSITSTDWKTQKLMKKYGRDIFGLTATNKDILRWEFIYPDLLDAVTNTLTNGN